MFFINFTNGCRSKRIVVLIHYIEKGYFLTGPVKQGINFKLSSTLFRVSFAVLCLRIGTQLTSKRPHLGLVSPQSVGSRKESMKFMYSDKI